MESMGLGDALLSHRHVKYNGYEQDADLALLVRHSSSSGQGVPETL